MRDRRLRALVVDDEALALVNLTHAIAQVPGWEVVASVTSARAARAALAAHPAVDAVLLDVQMPEEDGLSLARELARSGGPVVVFVTAHDQYAVDAFAVRALDYLQKPIDDRRLAETLVLAAELVALRERAAWAESVRDAIDEVGGAEGSLSRVCVRGVGRVETIRLAEVRRLTSAGNYVELHLPGRSVLHRSAFSAFANRLDPVLFLRVHRTAAVRRDLVRALSRAGDAWEVELEGGERAPVSARYVQGVRDLLEGG